MDGKRIVLDWNILSAASLEAASQTRDSHRLNQRERRDVAPGCLLRHALEPRPLAVIDQPAAALSPLLTSNRKLLWLS
jgi:hypothetical protein